MDIILLGYSDGQVPKQGTFFPSDFFDSSIQTKLKKLGIYSSSHQYIILFKSPSELEFHSKKKCSPNSFATKVLVAEMLRNFFYRKNSDFTYKIQIHWNTIK